MYDILQFIEPTHQSKVNDLLVQGFNTQGSFPDAGRVTEAFPELKSMTVMDPLKTGTTSFWENHGETRNVDPSKIQTEILRLPTSCFAEEAGSIVNSLRWPQWRHPRAGPPDEMLPDLDVLGELHMMFKEMYEKEGDTAPEPIIKLVWHYRNLNAPTPEKMAEESNDYALADLTDSDGDIVRKEGKLFDGFSQLHGGGTIERATWILSGSWAQVGNQVDRHDSTDSGLGNTPKRA